MCSAALGYTPVCVWGMFAGLPISRQAGRRPCTLPPTALLLRPRDATAAACTPDRPVGHRGTMASSMACSNNRVDHVWAMWVNTARELLDVG